jgi:hypothetical protein
MHPGSRARLPLPGGSIGTLLVYMTAPVLLQKGEVSRQRRAIRLLVPLRLLRPQRTACMHAPRPGPHN